MHDDERDSSLKTLQEHPLYDNELQLVDLKSDKVSSTHDEIFLFGGLEFDTTRYNIVTKKTLS